MARTGATCTRYWSEATGLSMLLAFLGIPSFAVGVFAVAFVLIGLLIWGSQNPVVWRLLAVVGIGTGVGLLVWGIVLAAVGDEPAIGSPAGIIATGAGVLASAIVLFVISFLRGKKARNE
jgi:hypothetical protein